MRIMNDELRKISQDSRHSARDSNPWPPEYKVVVQTMTLSHSVSLEWKLFPELGAVTIVAGGATFSLYLQIPE
jgi:hypothetical protein